MLNILQLERRLTNLERYGLPNLRIDSDPVQNAFKHDCILSVIARLKADLVRKHQEELVFQKCLQLVLARTVVVVFTLSQLCLQNSCMIRVPVTRNVQLGLVGA